jgi:hypothetical protein
LRLKGIRLSVSTGVCAALLLIVSSSALADVKEPPPSILGISLGMKEAAARQVLDKLGRLQKEERRRQEVWNLTGDPRYASLIIAFDKKQEVRYVTVFTHEGAASRGQRVRYSELGDVKSARLERIGNNVKYTWDVASKGGGSRYLVVARGTDAQYLSSYSIKRVE